MRPDCSWSMSTAGLTAQEVCLPSQALFLRGSHCHSMAGTKPSWNTPTDFENLYFSLKPHLQQPVPTFTSVDKSQSILRNCPAVQRLPPKKIRPSPLTLSSSSELFTPSPVEDDQVVPSFHRLSVCERPSPPHTPSRVAKPLPPLPGIVDLSSSDQAIDSEVGLFVADDSCSLVPEPCATKPSPFRYGAPSRRRFRDHGMINYAYHDGPTVQQRQPQTQSAQQHQHVQQHRRQDKDLSEQQPQQQHHQTQHQHHHHHQQQQQQQLQQHQQPQDRTIRKLRRSHSGPAGSFNKPTSLRLSCHHRNGPDLEKPEVPPRAPIPPRPAKTADYRRWSAEVSSGAYSDEDRPPKVPPREPLSSTSSAGGSGSTSARTPSPKSLPTYLNGIMPPTQSFAPDPKYVSRGLQRQNSEGSPCILPVMENGRKASNTHYFLLPQRPAYLDKVEKFLTDPSACQGGEAASRSDGDCQSKRRTPIDLV